MTNRRLFFTVLWITLGALIPVSPASAAGILGFQPGDRSASENAKWLNLGVQHIQLAIKEVEEGDPKTSIKHGKSAMAALKEIGSEGWDGRRQRSIRSVRYAISAAKKGKVDQASLKYREALEKLQGLRYGDMNFTHESFLGIGKLGTSGRDMAE